MADSRRVCHACGRELAEKNGILQEDALVVKKEWGYFSNKDLEIHEFTLCEHCYDTWTAGFVKPVHSYEKKEVLGE